MGVRTRGNGSFAVANGATFMQQLGSRYVHRQKLGRSADKGMGSVMHQFLVKSQNDDELEEILETYVVVDPEEVEEPVSPGPGNALLSELRDATADSRVEATDFEALREIQERKKMEKKLEKAKKKAS